MSLNLEKECHRDNKCQCSQLCRAFSKMTMLQWSFSPDHKTQKDRSAVELKKLKEQKGEEKNPG